MTDKEFRKLSRKELVEIIYELQKKEAALRRQNEELRAQLNDRRISLSKVGSIAEAALTLSGVFEAAQDAADRYLEAVHAAVRQTPQESAAFTQGWNVCLSDTQEDK